MALQLAAYLDRIGLAGTPGVDLATLQDVQRRHLLTIPYENLDVQLGRAVVTDPAAAVDKLVGRRRGGWCYEMNGLLGWALGEIGFPVTRLASGVMRGGPGDPSVGNHLVLRVELDGKTFLADAGLGDGPLTPYEVVDGPFTCSGFAYALERTEDGWWRLINRAGARPPYFDFHLERIDEALLTQRCGALQTDPQSLFVQNLICQRILPGGHLQLVGKVLRRTSGGEVTQSELSSAHELVEVLELEFGIYEPAAEGLWPKICARHSELFGNAPS